MNCPLQTYNFVGSLKNDLKTDGYALFDLSTAIGNHDHALRELRAAAKSMPLDLSGGGTGRFRQYGRAIYLPWEEDAMVYEPSRLHCFNNSYGIEYSQPIEVNSQAMGERRVFNAIPEPLYRNEIVKGATEYLWDNLTFDPDTKMSPISIGYHLVKTSPKGEIPAVASPNLVHRDGETFTAGILIDRVNADGGFNAITHVDWHNHKFEDVPKEGVFAKFTLDNALEGYIVQDDKVAHYVSPVHSVDPSQHAERTILLIDFTPLRPAINLTGIK